MENKVNWTLLPSEEVRDLLLSHLGHLVIQQEVLETGQASDKDSNPNNSLLDIDKTEDIRDVRSFQCLARISRSRHMHLLDPNPLRSRLNRLEQSHAPLVTTHRRRSNSQRSHRKHWFQSILIMLLMQEQQGRLGFFRQDASV